MKYFGVILYKEINQHYKVGHVCKLGHKKLHGLHTEIFGGRKKIVLIHAVFLTSLIPRHCYIILSEYQYTQYIFNY